MSHRLCVCVAAISDSGGRQVNEDSYLALHGDKAPCDTIGLLAVADGMGGAGNGHIASTLATETLADAFAAACEVSKGKPVAATYDLLRFAVQKANAAVYRSSQESEERKGMGTTCAAAAITDDRVHIAHVGDSRIYLFRDGRLQKLVDDQWVKPARIDRSEKAGTKRGGVTFVTNAVGWQPIISPEVTSAQIKEGDVLLVCTDGLTDELSETEIEGILRESPDVPAACDRLVRSACSGEGCDNVTLVIAKLLPIEQ